jgi:cystathionine beta-lyase/cystathionine gamma-synthase
VVSIWGLASNPFDCWLATRGLATLPLRIRAASANAAALADWLAEQPGVTRVIYPGRADHPDHEVAKRLLAGGFGNMLAFELAGGRDAVNRFMRNAKGIPFSPSLGNTTTTCSHPGTTSHRYVSPAEKKRQGISDGLIRLSVGVEDLQQIQREMAKGLS